MIDYGRKQYKKARYKKCGQRITNRWNRKHKDIIEALENIRGLKSIITIGGNDSIDSHEYFDACCPECAMKFAKDYIQDSFNRMFNSRTIEIKHVRSLSEGSVHS